MTDTHLTLTEVENLGYYDFMGYLNIPFFNIGGIDSIDRLAELTKISPTSHVLIVGCGTGGNACYLAQTYGCQITGIDISPIMIQQANDRAKRINLETQVNFQTGNAYALEFPEATFSHVITVFVSQFLDLSRAFPEFVRVLQPKGMLGINEMFRAASIPTLDQGLVDEGESVVRESIGLPFTLQTPTAYHFAFSAAHLDDILLEE